VRAGHSAVLRFGALPDPENVVTPRRLPARSAELGAHSSVPTRTSGRPIAGVGLPLAKKGPQLALGPCCRQQTDLQLERSDLERPRAFLALADLQLDFLAFAQRAEALAFDGRVMHEDITLGGLYEAEALRIVEPLDLPGNRVPISFPEARR
jgi:hypothetical protein